MCIRDRYNRILDEVKQLIDQNDELQKQTRIAQIRQLQSQFNPHFIFNKMCIRDRSAAAVW